MRADENTPIARATMAATADECCCPDGGNGTTNRANVRPTTGAVEETAPRQGADGPLSFALSPFPAVFV